jgi:peptide/nickel transport system permease protein
MPRPLAFVARRLGVVVSVLWGAATLAFIAVQAIPGDPVDILSGGANVVDAGQRAAVRAQYGLDRPLIVQYAVYLAHAFTGDLGTSYQYRAPVTAVLGEAVGPTVQLAVTAVALAVVVSFIAAVSTAGRRRGLRSVLAGGELVVLATPVYWIGIVALTIFSFQLGWFPVTGTTGWRSLVLPACTLALPLAALLAQVLRDGLEESLDEPFALTVRTRGVSETALRWRHGVRHSLLAVSTLTGTLLASVLGGSVLTETVFGRSGVGQVLLRAISARDMPLVLGVVMLAALVFVVINLLIDALYLLIDPRLRQAVR